MAISDTQIVIRERDFLDLLDLALLVVRRGGWRLAGIAAVGVAPMMLLNAWLLAAWTSAIDLDTLVDGSAETLLARTLYTAVVLVIVEMPLATAPVTLALSQIVFNEQPRLGRIARTLLASLGQLLVVIAYRAVLAPWVVTWPLTGASAPFAQEVILLERNPLYRRRGNCTLRRMRQVVPRSGSGPLGRWFLVAVLGTGLVLAGGMSLYVLRGMLSGQWQLDLWTHLFLFQGAVWLWVVFFAVVRFLDYLDTRIRNEGWELELLMRAEAERLPAVAPATAPRRREHSAAAHRGTLEAEEVAPL